MPTPNYTPASLTELLSGDPAQRFDEWRSASLDPDFLITEIRTKHGVYRIRPRSRMERRMDELEADIARVDALAASLDALKR